MIPKSAPTTPPTIADLCDELPGDDTDCGAGEVVTDAEADDATVTVLVRVEELEVAETVELGFEPIVESGLLSANASFTLNVFLAVTFKYAQPGIEVKDGIAFGYLRTRRRCGIFSVV